MACVSLSDHRDTETADIICAERPCEVRNYAGKKAESLYRELYRVYEKSDRWNPEEMAAVDCGEPGTDYHTERYAYNHRGQLTFTEDTCGGKHSAEYDTFGNLTMVTNPYGYRTHYGHDRDGNTVSRTNALRIREYLLEYDALGNVAFHTDGNENVTKYTRDASGNVVRVTGPDEKTDKSVTYNVWGRQRGVTDGNGSTTQFTRDRAGRVTTVEKPDGSREYYSYDYAGNITKGTDGNGSTTQFLYNGAGLPEVIRKADGTERLFGYDSEERCISRRDDEKGNTAYRYKRDSEGRVTEKSDSRGKLFEIRYNPDGMIDRLGRLESLKAGFAGETALLDAKYAYDGNGNRTGEEEKLFSNCTGKEEKLFMQNGKTPTGAVTQYAYDSMNRLTMEIRNGSKTAYTYDMAGNRTSRLKGDDKEQYVTVQPRTLHLLQSP